MSATPLEEAYPLAIDLARITFICSEYETANLTKIPYSFIPLNKLPFVNLEE